MSIENSIFNQLPQIRAAIEAAGGNMISEESAGTRYVARRVDGAIQMIPVGLAPGLSFSVHGRDAYLSAMSKAAGNSSNN